MLQVVDWGHLYENSKTRDLKTMFWVPVPNKHDGFGYRTVISQPDGEAIMGVWLLILQVASKCHHRGLLAQANGNPHTPETIARMTGANPQVIQRAIEVLISDEVGWLANVEQEQLKVRHHKDASSEEKRKARGRVNRFIENDKPVCTPLGPLIERPVQCQWCSSTPPMPARGQPGIVAHHLAGYGTYEHDTTVIFVCRSCHGFFESGKFLTQHVLDRFGTDWLPLQLRGSDTAVEGGAVAVQCRDTATSRVRENGMEWNGSAAPNSNSSSNTHSENLKEKAGAVVADLAKDHPIPGNVNRATDACEAVLAQSADVEAACERIRESHKRFVPHWISMRARNPNVFIPQLHKWFIDRDYLHPPGEQAAAARASPVREERGGYLRERLRILEAGGSK